MVFGQTVRQHLAHGAGPHALEGKLDGARVGDLQQGTAAACFQVADAGAGGGQTEVIGLGLGAHDQIGAAQTEGVDVNLVSLADETGYSGAAREIGHPGSHREAQGAGKAFIDDDPAAMAGLEDAGPGGIPHDAGVVPGGHGLERLGSAPVEQALDLLQSGGACGIVEAEAELHGAQPAVLSGAVSFVDEGFDFGSALSQRTASHEGGELGTDTPAPWGKSGGAACECGLRLKDEILHSHVTGEGHGFLAGEAVLGPAHEAHGTIGVEQLVMEKGE